MLLVLYLLYIYKSEMINLNDDEMAEMIHIMLTAFTSKEFSWYLIKLGQLGSSSISQIHFKIKPWPVGSKAIVLATVIL